jgi:6-phosphogluconolactonase
VSRNRALTLFAVLVLYCAAPAPAHADSVAGAVYTSSNAPAGNQILIFDRAVDGTLTAASTVATGGAGTGGGLGNQSALTLSADGRWLLAVNAASNDISLLSVRANGLELRDLARSGGVNPISVTVHDDLVYVLNAGSDTVSGLRITPDGRLTPIDGSARALSGNGTGPAQLAFTPDGRVLIVSEKNTDLIDTFRVRSDGTLDGVRSTPSHGATPFGFAFGQRDQLLVSEAFGGAPNASAVSSYDVDRDGSLVVESGSVPTNQSAACWVLVTKGGRFAYTSNTGSGSLAGFAIGHDGAIALLTANGRTGVTGAGSAPIDLATSDDGRFLYALNSATHTIGVFSIEADGRLVALPFAGGLPAGANGLAAR